MRAFSVLVPQVDDRLGWDEAVHELEHRVVQAQFLAQLSERLLALLLLRRGLLVGLRWPQLQLLDLGREVFLLLVKIELVVILLWLLT